MTEQQKKALGEARKNTLELKWMSSRWMFQGYGNAIMDVNAILDALDAIEADMKCKPERQPIYEGGEQVQWSAYACDKCGCGTLEKYPYCPGCGREVER